MTAYELFQGLSEQTSKSSQLRKEQMGSTSLRRKPDLQIILKQGTVEDELILAKALRLFPQHDKEDLD
nr:13364_t:CDS:2 [Entrophospora candida]